MKTIGHKVLVEPETKLAALFLFSSPFRTFINDGIGVVRQYLLLLSDVIILLIYFAFLQSIDLLPDNRMYQYGAIT